MDNSKKYKIKEGAFSWLLKTLVGKDNAAKLLYYKRIKTDPKLYKMSKDLEKKVDALNKSIEKSHYNDPLFDKDELNRLRRDI
jgi:predicted secreted Zn-dependent protease